MTRSPVTSSPSKTLLAVLAATAVAAAHPGGGPQLESQKLLAPGGEASDAFGDALAVSGGTLFIGSRGSDGGGPNSGAVHLFDAQTGSPRGLLFASDTSPSSFGTSIAVSSGRVLVGASSGFAGFVKTGTAFLFDEATGTELLKLAPIGGTANGLFGIAVALDGTHALVGASLDDGNGSAAGAAYLFDLSTGLQVTQLLSPTRTADELFGSAVTIAQGIAFVGAPESDLWQSDGGVVHGYDVTTGQKVSTIGFEIAPSGRFGFSLAAEGSTVIAGAPTQGNGAAYVFDVNGSLLMKLTPQSKAEYFGNSVAIEGSIALVGAQRTEGVDGQLEGAAFAFDLTTGAQIAKFMASDRDDFDQLGLSVALNGRSAFAGTPLDDDFGSNSGSVYRFDVTCGPGPYCTPKVSSSGCQAFIEPDPGVAVSGANDFHVDAVLVEDFKNGLLFGSNSGTANLPFNGGVLCVQPPTKRGPIQFSGGGATCSGFFSSIVNDGQIFPAGHDAGPGNSAWYQYWYRDQQNGVGALGTALSNATQVDFQ